MDRMRAAKNNLKEERHDLHKTNELKRQKPIRKGKGFEKQPKTGPEITAKDSPVEKNNQLPDSDRFRENASKQSATQLDSLKAQRSPELLDASKESRPGTNDPKQSEKLDWFSTWDEE